MPEEDANWAAFETNSLKYSCEPLGFPYEYKCVARDRLEARRLREETRFTHFAVVMIYRLLVYFGNVFFLNSKMNYLPTVHTNRT